MSTSCELTVLEGPSDQKGQVFVAMADQRPTIGRSSACDFRVEDELMSGMHGQLYHTPDGWRLRDLLSRNGVLVDEALVSDHAIQPGEVIQVGHTLLEFKHSGEAPPPPAGVDERQPTRVIPLDGGGQIDPLRQTKVWTGPPSKDGKQREPMGRMIEKRSDIELAKLALKNDLLDHKQIKECIDIQAEMKEVKIHMTVEEIFQEREYLTREQIQQLSREYKYTRRRTKDLFYAEVAISNKLVPQSQVDACLKLQEEAFRKGDKIPYLGELLVKQGHISIADNNRVIRGIKAYREGDEELHGVAAEQS